MRLDLIRCGRGWYALYIDGYLQEYDSGDPLDALAEHISEHYVDRLQIMSLGKCGREALKHGLDMPDEVNDIDQRWWTDIGLDFDASDD